MINYNSKIFVAGHKGLVGSAIVRKLKEKGYKKIVVVDRKKLDLTNQTDVLLQPQRVLWSEELSNRSF